MDAQDGGSNLLFVVLGFGILITIISRSERSEPDLRLIPTFGHQGYLRSYIDALRFVIAGPTILRTAYERFQPGIFRIATLHRWLVVVTGSRLLEELRKLPEEELSLAALTSDTDFPLYHIGHERIFGSKDIETFSRYLTQNLPLVVPEMKEEVSASLQDLPLNSSGWTEVESLDLVLQLITAVNHRMIFGHSSDRHSRKLGLMASKETIASSYSLTSSLLPRLRAMVFAYFFQKYRTRRQFQDQCSRIVSSRRSLTSSATISINHDLLSWTLQNNPDASTSLAKSLSDLDISTTSSICTTFLHVLYHISANPKYASPIRKEVGAVTFRDGWTKASLDKMHKLDSFLKESLRLSSVNSVSFVRKALVDITLSDGTILPRGTVICTASRPRHLDSDIYGPSSTTFDGFRFSKLQEQYYATCEPDQSDMVFSTRHIKAPLPRYQLTTCSTSYLSWGYGRHACPGRFYASAVMKLVLAIILKDYDIRLEDGVRPKDLVCNGGRRMPGRDIKILIRKR